MPILDGASPGALFRSLVEIHCWFCDLFDSDPRGLRDVLEKFTQILKELTSNCTPLCSPDVYTYLFPADIQSSSLRPITFTSASSSPDSVCSPSRKATMELLLCLTQVLNRDFCTYLGPELHLPRDQTTISNGTKELHFTLIGGSILGKTKKHLETLGVKVKDLTKPGWVANTANSQRVMHEATGSEIPEGSIIILDVLGNSSVRFEQADDSCSLPVKVNGSWHLLGKVKVMEDEQVEKCLFTVEHLGKQLHRDSWKIYVSPSPRWLRGPCCYDLSHCTNFRMDGYGRVILNDLYRVRRCMKKCLMESHIRNFRVLDTLGALTGKNTIDEQISAMHSITSKDNVHLTEAGYAALAQGLVREAHNCMQAKQKGKGSIAGNARMSTREWRGFISNTSTGRTDSGKALKSFPKSSLRGRTHPYMKRGGK